MLLCPRQGSTRQRVSGKKSVGKEFFVERLLSGTRLDTRQRKVTVTAPVALAHALPNAMLEALDKDFLIFFFKISLPSALPGRHSANIFLFFLIISLPSALPGRRSANIF